MYFLLFKLKSTTKKIIVLIFLCFNLSITSQVSIKELNNFEIKLISDKNTLTSRQFRELNDFKKNIYFYRDASKKKVFWPNKRPKKVLVSVNIIKVYIPMKVIGINTK